MAHHSDEHVDLSMHPITEERIKAQKAVYKGMWLLAAVTLLEVFVSLFGKGHLGFDPSNLTILLAIVAIAIIVLSIYKAYYIVYKFMHMGHEVKGLRMTVLLPMCLLIWALIAFFSEGNYWKDQRANIIDKNSIELDGVKTPQIKSDTKDLNKDH